MSPASSQPVARCLAGRRNSWLSMRRRVTVLSAMSFEIPQYDRSIVDTAGDALIGYEDALDRLAARELNHAVVIDNWRAAHAYPLNTFAMTLRRRAHRVDAKALVAQRSKRVRSIRDKLNRYDSLKLSTMQDIGGCRAIVSSVDQVYALVELYQTGYSDHQLVTRNDYIRKPKSDGYRSYHLVYEYADDGHPAYCGLKIEMQFRTQLQHCWATAVETVDVFLREGLKSHRGSPDWKRFFALAGSAIALSENCRVAPRTPKNLEELRGELRDGSGRLGVPHLLRAFGETLNIVGEEDTRRYRVKFIIMALDTSTTPPDMTLTGYLAGQLDEANTHYGELEDDGIDAVLVSVPDAANLRSAYPNYFLDTRYFVAWLEQFIQ